jgi:DNA replication protein DnaC
MTTEVISPDLKVVLRRLKLSPLLDTLPERLVLARQQKTPHQDWLLLLLSDEVARRNSLAISLRAQRAHLDPTMHLEAWDPTAKVTLDRALLNELVSLRFLDAHAHVAIVGPVGVGKTFLAHALGHIACRRGASVLARRTDQMLKTLKHARLDNSHETELRKLISVDLLVLDDFAIDVLDATESRDLYEILLERYRIGSMIVTSNRGPDEWLATFADPVRAQSAIDRFTSNAYDLVIEGESYRPRLKPSMAKEGTR